MATVKVKFRPSRVDGKEGTVYYQIIHQRAVRLLKTPYRVFPDEWDRSRSQINVSQADGRRRKDLLSMAGHIRREVHSLHRLIAAFERRQLPYSVSDLWSAFRADQYGDFLFIAFMRRVIDGLKQAGKQRTSETYTSACSSFLQYHRGEDIPLDAVDSDCMVAYEAWLKSRGVSMNTVSFYMRILRAVYNRAVDKGLVQQRLPFRHVYTGVEKTIKRAIPLQVIRRLKSLDFSGAPSRAYARDLFFFSFYTRGMSLVDMAFLRKKDLNHGVLSYRRKKTGQQLFIKWEPCMQEILDRYPCADSPYLLPIIRRPGADERSQYLNESHRINHHLKLIGESLGLPVALTLYVARHAWASIARSRNIPVSVISEGMGHHSEATTRIYLASLDTAIVDKANNQILSLL